MPDWHSMFSPTSLLEVVLRGSVMYFFIFSVLRLVRRETGTLSTADVLVIVLIADAAQNGMSADYASLPEGMVLVLTIVLWSVALDLASYHVPIIGKFVHPQPIELVRQGQVLRKNMRQNLITYEELMTFVRQAGAQEIGNVKRAWLEGNGEVSVILAD